MQQKYTRLAMAMLLVLSMCPSFALAAEGPSKLFTQQNPSYKTTEFPSGDEGAAAQAATGTLYSNTLTAPALTTSANFISGTGISICSEASDLVNDGILLGSANNLFYFREMSFPREGGGFTSGFKSFEMYDIATATWSYLPSLPEWLEYCSIVKFGATDQTEGFLVWAGVTMDNDGTGIPVHAANPEQRVYIYNMADEYPEWVAASTTNLPLACGLVNNGGLLQAVGGLVNGSPTGHIYDYELSEGAIETQGSLSQPVLCPQVKPFGGKLYVTSYASSLVELQSGSGTPQMQVYSSGSSQVLPGAFPEVASPADASLYPSPSSWSYGATAWAENGCVYVGPLAADNSTDTFMMPWDGSAFAPYSLTASDTMLSGAAATVYIGNLYALGSTMTSSGGSGGGAGGGSGGGSGSDDSGGGTGSGDAGLDTSASDSGVAMVFRSTPMQDAGLLEGNGANWEKNSKDGLTFVFSPDFSRFKQIVQIDGVPISIGDYDAHAGSTVIVLYADYLQLLESGEHTLTAMFDGGNTEVKANFTISGVANQDPEGITIKDALAATFDKLPIIPIAIVAVIALGAVGFAFYRKSSRR